MKNVCNFELIKINKIQKKKNLRGRNSVVDLDLHISFTSRIALHRGSEFVAFPKTLQTKSLHETVKKRCKFVANLTEGPNQRNRRQEILMKQKV